MKRRRYLIRAGLVAVIVLVCAVAAAAVIAKSSDTPATVSELTCPLGDESCACVVDASCEDDVEARGVEDPVSPNPIAAIHDAAAAFTSVLRASAQAVSFSVELRLRHVVGVLLISCCFPIAFLVVRFVKARNKIELELGPTSRAVSATPDAMAHAQAVTQLSGNDAARPQIAQAAENGAATESLSPRFWFLQPLTVYITGGGWPSGWMFLVPKPTAADLEAYQPSHPFVFGSSAMDLDRFKLLFCTQAFFGHSHRKNHSTIHIPQQNLLRTLQRAFAPAFDVIAQDCGDTSLPLFGALAKASNGIGPNEAAKMQATRTGDPNSPIFSPVQVQLLLSRAYELWYIPCAKPEHLARILSGCSTPAKLTARRYASPAFRFALPLMSFQQKHLRLGTLALPIENEGTVVSSESKSHNHGNAGSLTIAADLQLLESRLASTFFPAHRNASWPGSAVRRAVDACVNDANSVWPGQEVGVVIEGPTGRIPSGSVGDMPPGGTVLDAAATESRNAREKNRLHEEHSVAHHKAVNRQEHPRTNTLEQQQQQQKHRESQPPADPHIPEHDFVVMLPVNEARRAMRDRRRLAALAAACRPRKQRMFARRHRSPFPCTSISDAENVQGRFSSRATLSDLPNKLEHGQTVVAGATADDSGTFVSASGEATHLRFPEHPTTICSSLVFDPVPPLLTSNLGPDKSGKMASATISQASKDSRASPGNTITAVNPTRYVLLYFMYSEDGTSLLSVNSGPSNSDTLLHAKDGTSTVTAAVYFPKPIALVPTEVMIDNVVDSNELETFTSSEDMITPRNISAERLHEPNAVDSEHQTLRVGAQLRSLWLRPPQKATTVFSNVWVALLRLDATTSSASSSNTAVGELASLHHEVVEAMPLNACRYVDEYIGYHAFQGPVHSGVHCLAMLSSAAASSRGLFRFLGGRGNGAKVQSWTKGQAHDVLWIGPRFVAEPAEITLVGPQVLSTAPPVCSTPVKSPAASTTKQETPACSTTASMDVRSAGRLKQTSSPPGSHNTSAPMQPQASFIDSLKHVPLTRFGFRQQVAFRVQMAASANVQYQVSLYRLCGEIVTGLVDVTRNGIEAVARGPGVTDESIENHCIPEVYTGCLHDLQAPGAAGSDVGGHTASFSSLVYHEEHLSLEDVGHSRSLAASAKQTSSSNSNAGCFLCHTLDCDFDFQGPTKVPPVPLDATKQEASAENVPCLAEVKPRHEYISNVNYTEGTRLYSGNLFDDAHWHSSTSTVSFEISFEPPLPGIYFAALHRKSARPAQQHKPKSPDSASDARFLLMRDVQCESKSHFFRVDTPCLQTNAISCQLTDTTDTRYTSSTGSGGCTCCVREPDGFKLCGDVIRATIAASSNWLVGQADSVSLQRFDWRSAGTAIDKRCKHTADVRGEMPSADCSKRLTAKVLAFASAAARGVPLPVVVEAHAWHKQHGPLANTHIGASMIPPDWLEKSTTDPSKKLWHIGFEDEHVRCDGPASNDSGEKSSSCDARGHQTCTVAIRAGSKTQKLPAKPGYYALLYRGIGALSGEGHSSPESAITMTTFHVGLCDPRFAAKPVAFQLCSSQAPDNDPVVAQNAKFQDFFTDALRQSRTLRNAEGASNCVPGQGNVWSTVAHQPLLTSKRCKSCGCLNIEFDGSATPQQPGLYRIALCTNRVPLSISDTFFVGAPFIHPPSSQGSDIDSSRNDNALESCLWWNADLVAKVEAGAHLDRRGTLELLEIDTREMPSLDEETAADSEGAKLLPKPQNADSSITDVQGDPRSDNNTQVAQQDLNPALLHQGNLLLPPVCGCRVQLVAHNVSAHRLILCVATSPRCDATDFVAAYRIRAIRSRDTHELPPRLHPSNADFVKGSECAVGEAEMLADDTMDPHEQSRDAVALVDSKTSSTTEVPAEAPLSDDQVGTCKVVGAEPTAFKQAELRATEEDEQTPGIDSLVKDSQPSPYYRYGGYERVLDMPVKWLKLADGDYEMRYVICSKSSSWIFRSQYHCAARSFCQIRVQDGRVSLHIPDPPAAANASSLVGCWGPRSPESLFRHTRKTFSSASAPAGTSAS